ncbi:MAG TPA: sodium:solute symporter [Hyphomicrobiaceae bacterium]|nr:sodium:solute symporter [Hyphomicrobiaceae bacterium]
MAHSFRTRLVNPRLGAYFGIFSSLLVTLFIALLILEQLGVSDRALRYAMLLGPLALFAAIAAASWTTQSRDFFAAGRRVPAAYSGLVLAVTAIGGTGFVAWPGLFFINGFDAWCLFIGVVLGFVVMGVSVAPYVRKAGAYTVPTFLARRFQSRLLRVTAASVFIVPMLLVLAAELTMSLWVTMLLAQLSPAIATALIVTVVSATVIVGGMRGLGWVGTAQAITAVISILTLATMAGLIATNFPLAQFSYGPVLRAIGRLEVAQQIPVPALSAFAFDLAGPGLEHVTRRFATPFGSVGPVAFTLATITIATGVAASPWLLPRAGTTVGVYEARKSLGWAVFFAGVIALTLSAIAVFARDYLMQDLVGRTAGDLPKWFTDLRGMGLAGIADEQSALAMMNFSFRRDGLLLALPLASGFPAMVTYAVLVGAIAASLAGAAATTYAIATLLSEDIIGGLRWDPPSDPYRLGIARLMTIVVALIGLVFVSVVKTDPLSLFLLAMGITGSSAFPVVFLSIWWKRLTVSGAIAAILAGFGTAMLALLAGQVVWLPVPSVLLGVVGFLPALAAAIVVSKLTPVPDRDVLEHVRDTRIPGGETVYDRELRLHRLQQTALKN